MKIKMLVELDYENLESLDKEELDYAYKMMLESNPEDSENCLILHSNYLGNELGTIKVLEIVGTGKKPESKTEESSSFDSKTCECLHCSDLRIKDFLQEGNMVGWQMEQRFKVCPICKNKRCPKNSHHDNECTNSNEPGQPGSIF